jgi:hypothetical protein
MKTARVDTSRLKMFTSQSPEVMGIALDVIEKRLV